MSHTTKQWKVVAGGLILTLTLAGAARAALVHRYSFSEAGGSGTTLNDSVGTAHATIVEGGSNNGDVGTTYSGQVFLTGGAKGASDYVKFPNGTISAFTGDATFEFWATTYSVQNWSRVFSWGSATNDFFTQSWSQGTNPNTDQVRWYDAGVTGDNNNLVNNSMWPLGFNVENHLVYTVDGEATGPSTKTVVTWYKNGVQKGTFDTDNKLSDLNDVESVLGRSKFGDNTANASWNEVRMYDHAATNFEIHSRRLVGPDNLNTQNIDDATTLPLVYHTINLETAVGAGKINYDQLVLAGGAQTLGGVPFDIVDVGGNNGWNSHWDGGNGSDQRSLVIPVNVAGVIEAHALLGTFWGEQAAGTRASLIFTATDATTLTVELDGNSELRDYQNGAHANSINGFTTTQVLGTSPRVDKTRIILPDEWRNLTLQSITLEDRGVNGVQRTFITGLTVAQVPEPGTFTLLILGGVSLLTWRPRSRRRGVV